MADRNRELMEQAIRLAAECDPIDPDRIPKVGAVIAVGGQIIGAGKRGTGGPGDDDHAELNALGHVTDMAHLPEATVFTTLEPCTPLVRSQPGNSCTERLLRAQVKKVYIGILDPNQGVCGKGVLELQKHKIEVELFPNDLAQRIRLLMDRFIMAQQGLGIDILDPEPEAVLETHNTGGKYTGRCECVSPPGRDVFVFAYKGGSWWPQPNPLRQTADPRVWEFDVHFGTHGPHTIHLVKASELGINLINYYRKIARANDDRKERLRSRGLPEADVQVLYGGYPGIEMPSLPKGLESQASVHVNIATPPKAKN
jgi:pyrimidine deaminase RibD-like protein